MSPGTVRRLRQQCPLVFLRAIRDESGLPKFLIFATSGTAAAARGPRYRTLSPEPKTLIRVNPTQDQQQKVLEEGCMLKRLIFAAVGMLAGFLVLPHAGAAQPAGYYPVCIIIHGGDTSKSVSVVPQNFSVGNCKLLAAGYEQRPPAMGGTTYELGCITDSGALLATTPTPITAVADPHSTAWSGPNPGRPPVEYSNCASIWGGS
jgi:hypothetical protein